MLCGSDGRVLVCGERAHLRLGQIGSHEQPHSQMLVVEMKGFGSGQQPAIAVAAGSEHTVVLGASGWAWGCGSGFRGRLGTGNEEPQGLLVRVGSTTWRPNKSERGKTPQTPLVNVAAGAVATAAITSDGRLWTCGAGAHGVLGHGDTTTQVRRS